MDHLRQGPDGGLTIADDLPLVDLEGDPKEQGLLHGRKAKDRVAHNVSLYLRHFRTWSGVSGRTLRERAASYARVIEEANPEYAAFMDGVAAGSGQDVVDIVAINVRYELLYSEFARVGMEGKAAPSTPGGCTSFAISPERSANGHTLLGQNWDWIPEVQGMLQRASSGGLRHLAFTEAGIVGGKIGMNTAKLGLAVNGLVSNQDSWARLRTPFHVRCWEILGSRSVDEAKARILETERSCSSNFVIAQGGRAPEIVDVESAPRSARELRSRDGYLAHTNHFSDPDGLGIWQPLAGDRPSTYHRYDRATTLLGSLGERGSITIEDMQGLLRDHDGGHLSICRHPDETLAPPNRFATLVSVVMDLDDGVMFLAAGPPCTSPYGRFELEA